ncbi:2-nitropropane dioxygenase [Streptomonospora alba]|uniref:Propionate 3-nitronate monooxygenase n=1 Tax=Streptomonospora alba TaxID=183763 RepID=A0A0C2FIZ1_9ACTN|nr:nitronate monooxygenase [Streptomonospora alba]KIH99179.1 2-nitropropane dioxygenase [Streptomonospora alba]
MGILRELDVGVIAAPMAGGASTPELAAAVGAAGGLGFLAAGYLTAEAMGERIGRLRALTDRPFGVNLFVPARDTADPQALAAYRERMEREAARLGVEPGAAVWGDDDYPAKLAALRADPVPLVSFTFGCPAPADIASLRRAGTEVMVTVTTSAEAEAAADAGADALCVQGAEAGGHQASFEDAYERTIPLAQLLAEVRARVRLPVVAAGGIGDAAEARRALTGGAVAVQLGTALLCTPESGAAQVHKDALLRQRFARTAVTRAFSGRRARALANRFLAEHDGSAPAAYPHIHHMTAPLRAAAARAAAADTVHLWAGTAFRAVRERPAAEVVADIAADL